MPRDKKPVSREEVPIPSQPHPELTDAIIIALSKMIKDTTRARGTSAPAAPRGSAGSGEQSAPKERD